MIELEISIGFLLALEQSDFERLDTMLAEEMQFRGFTQRTLCKGEFINLMRRVRTGISGWKTNFYNVQVRGNTVCLTTEFSGTHSCLLPGLFPGMAAHPPTGKSFHLPPERVEITLDFREELNGRISCVLVEPVSGGGIPGMLEQLEIFTPVSN